MKKKNYEVMAKILFAVETGGQIYGNEKYDCIIPAGYNTPNEKAITIGAAGWYAGNANKLLILIRDQYPNAFSKYDTENISSDLDTKNWSEYSIPVPSNKSDCIKRIIGSDEGIKCQNILMISDIERYEKSIVKEIGDMTDEAMMECVNIIHQGGMRAVKRIINKTTLPLSHHTIYAALNTDLDDKTNNNQVGDYKGRQKKVYEMIENYAEKEGLAMGRTAEDVLNVMRSWIGYSEQNGKFKEIIDIYNSVRPLPRGYKVKYTDEWCDTTVSAAFIKAGCSELIGRECGCEEHINIFKRMGIWNEDGSIRPQPGHIILYSWKTHVQPNDGRANHIGIVEKVSGNTITVIEGNIKESVGRRNIEVGDGRIRGFGMPKYCTYKETFISSGFKGLVTNQSVNYFDRPNGNAISTVLNSGQSIHPTKRTVGTPSLLNYWFKNENGWIAGDSLTGWIYDTAVNKWWYIKNGKTLYNCWENIDGKDYFFMKDGYLAVNQYVGNKSRQKLYWVNSNGEYVPEYTMKDPASYGIVYED